MLNRILVIFTCLIITLQAFSQTRFVLGFNDGFKNGYCYTSNKTGYFCTPPLPPLAPLPQINESKDSYQDGYNRGFIYGQARRSKDDANTSNSNPPTAPPKFNPYISQSPVLNMTPEERAMYYASKAKKDQDMANAIGSILEAIFTTTEEGRARRAERKAKRNLEREMKNDIRRREKDDREKGILVSNKKNSYNNQIIGSSIKLGTFEIARYDFPQKMIWQDAEKSCASLGSGWRLPTKEELSLMYEYREKLGNYSYGGYWSSTVKSDGVWCQNFANGYQSYGEKTFEFTVRAVRSL